MANINGIKGNDTLVGSYDADKINGGAGNDTLNVDASTGDNLLNGNDGNDSLSASRYYYGGEYEYSDTSGNNTLNGGTVNDTLNINYSTGDTALAAAMRYILKAESDDRRGARRKVYCIIAGSAVTC